MNKSFYLHQRVRKTYENNLPQLIKTLHNKVKQTYDLKNDILLL